MIVDDKTSSNSIIKELSRPRTTQEAAELTEEQFHYLMTGLNPLEPKIKVVKPEKIY